MSNFLSNLVQRFNQPTPAVQARPVSLFEPQTQFDLSPWAGIEQPEEAGTGIEASADASQAHIPRNPASAQLATEPHPQNPLAKPPTPEVEGPPAQLGYLVVHMENQADFSLKRAESQFEADSAPVAESTERTPVRAPNPGAESHLRERPALHRLVNAPPKPGAPAILQIQPRKPATFPGQASITAQREHQAASTSAEPVINVTIGRVEVIAETPKASLPPPKAKRPNPVMSLDEYLKSRDQERPR